MERVRVISPITLVRGDIHKSYREIHPTDHIRALLLSGIKKGGLFSSINKGFSD